MEKPFSPENLKKFNCLSLFINIPIIIKKNKFIIVIIIIVVIALVYTFIPRKKMVYEAAAKILVKPKISTSNINITQFENKLNPVQFQTSIKTYIELIKSLNVSEAAAKILISQNVKKSGEGEGDFNLSNSVAEMSNFIQSHISADYDEKSNILRIISRFEDENLSIKIVNLVTTVFLNYNKNLEKIEIKKAISYIAEQKNIANNKLKKAEENLTNLKKDINQKIYIENGNVINEKIIQLEKFNNKLIKNEEILKRKINELRNTNHLNDKNSPSSSAIQSEQLKKNYNELLETYKEKSLFMKEKHPELQRIKKELNDLQQALQKDIDNQHSILRTTDNFIPEKTKGLNLSNNIIEIERKIQLSEKNRQENFQKKKYWSQQLKAQPIVNVSITQTRLLNDIEKEKKNYMQLIQREEELYLMEARATGGLTIVTRSNQAYLITPPDSQILIIGFGIALGLVIGVFFAIIREYSISSGFLA